MSQEIEEQGMALADVRAFARHLSAMAEMAEPDKQGRIIIPQNLREFAGVNGEVIVIGVVNRLEVWNPEKYKEVNKKVEADADVVAERYGQIMKNAAAKNQK